MTNTTPGPASLDACHGDPEAVEADRALNTQMCLASAERWRRSAVHLRDRAALPHLAPDVSSTLLREAGMADAMAAWWAAGAAEH